MTSLKNLAVAPGTNMALNGLVSTVTTLNPMIRHLGPYVTVCDDGAAIDNQGNADCEIGQRGYPKKLNYFDPQGRNIAVDPHTPGDQGPTFAGRARVPAGETFSRAPSTGPQLAPIPNNP